MSSSDEALWPLPKTWEWTTAGDITRVIGGGTPDTKDSGNFGGTVPWVTPADMSTHIGKTIVGGSRSLTEKGLVGSGAKWLPEGTVLFSSRAPIGYTAIASKPVTTNQGFKSFVPESCITSDYLYHWLASSKERAEKLASGTTFLEISGAKAALLPIPLAPLAEQIRIVEKLEKLLSDLDAGVAELKAAQRKLAQYRQSLLKAAMEGTLTTDWRATQGKPQETGAELLQRILSARRTRWEQKQLAKFTEQGKTPPKNWRIKYPEPVSSDLKDLPPLPAGWVWATLDQAAAEALIGLDRGQEHQSMTGNVGYIKMNNVSMNGDVETNDIVRLHSDPDEISRYEVAKDDLLFNTRNSKELVGKVGLVRAVNGSTVYNNNLMRIRFDGLVTPELACYQLCGPDFRGRMEKVKKATTSVAAVYSKDLFPLAIAVPPLDEQAEIVIRLNVAISSIKQQEASIVVSLRQAAAQRKNLLKAAFAGQLVPQDPSDEPASELLARIRVAQTNASGGAARKRGRKAKKAV